MCDWSFWQVGKRYLQAGKYNATIFKGHLIIALHGLILLHTFHLGVDNDDTIMDVLIAGGLWSIEPGEWGFGDKAYIAIERLLCGNKPEETQFDTFWNSIIAFYRARVEIVIARLKKHAWCQVPFRGRYDTLIAYTDFNVTMTALEIRREIEHGKPMFEVCGPWPHDFA